MKKMITLSLLMIFMIVLNTNAQTLNNVITNKNSFGPIKGSFASKYVIINDSLYSIGSPNIKLSESNDFKDVVFMYNDMQNNILYIGTKTDSLYMYNPNGPVGPLMRSTPLKSSGVATITSSIDNKTASSSPTILYVSTNDKIWYLNLNTAATSTATYIAGFGYYNNSGIISMEYDHINLCLIYSKGNTVYKDDIINPATIYGTYTSVINDIRFINNKLYCATNSGVVNITDNIIVSNTIGNAYNIVEVNNNPGLFDGTDLYFSNVNGSIFKNNGNNQILYNPNVGVSKCNSITFNYNVLQTSVLQLWAGTDKGLFTDDADVAPLSTGIDELNLENTLGLFPIPNNGTFNYKTKFEGDLELFNIAGQLVFEKKLEENTVTKLELNVVSGIYIARFKCDHGTISKKFMVIN